MRKMIAGRTYLRALALALAAPLGALAACGSGAVSVGDDSRDASSATDAPVPDAPPSGADAAPPLDDGSTSDAKSDAPPGACASAAGGGAMCLPPGSACETADTTGLTCAKAGELCCVVSCPELAQPPPGFCDGGGYAALYDSKACIVGFACTPIACTTAGGTCVGLAPGTCPKNNFGDATKYSCGGGVGTGCCLP